MYISDVNTVLSLMLLTVPIVYFTIYTTRKRRVKKKNPVCLLGVHKSIQIREPEPLFSYGFCGF